MGQITWNKRILLCLFVFSVYCSIVALPRLVDAIQYWILPSDDLLITVLESQNQHAVGHAILLTGFGAGPMDGWRAYNRSAFQAFASIAKGGNGFVVVPIDEKSGAYELSAVEPGSRITLRVKPQSNFWIRAIARPDAGTISIRYKGVSRVFDFFAESSGENYVYPMLGRFNILSIALRSMLYFILSVAGFLLSASCYAFYTRNKRSLENISYHPFLSFMIVFVLMSLYCYVRRKSGDSPVPYGDTTYYWGIVGGLGLPKYPQDPITFRGYLLPSIAYVMQRLSFGRFNAFNQYAVFSSLATSSFLTVIIPNLYRKLTGKKPQAIQVFIFAIVYLYFWRDFTFYVLTDQFALLSFFSFLFFILKYLRDERRLYLNAFLSGLCLCATILLHLGYSLILYLVLMIFLVGSMWNLLKSRMKAPINLPEMAKAMFARLEVRGSAMLLFGVLTMAIPQLYINIERVRTTEFGRLTPFPYDYKGVWQSKEQTLSEYVLFFSLRFWSQLNPYNLYDRPGEDILRNTYPNIDSTKATLSDFANIIISRPLDYVALMGNKLFLLLDIKEAEEYPLGKHIGRIEWLFFDSIHGTYLFSLLNYFILGLALGFLLTKQLRETLTRHEMLLLAAIFILVGLPRLNAHSEWRYFMPVYVMAYYLFSYSIVGNSGRFSMLPRQTATKFLLIVFGAVNFFYFLSRLYYTSLV